jgi:hypothetical protein
LNPFHLAADQREEKTRVNEEIIISITTRYLTMPRVGAMTSAI